MAVRRLKNGKWQADVTLGVKWDGSRDRRTKTCPTQKEAKAAERAFLIERDGRRGVSGRITFREYVTQLWWPQKAGMRRSSRDTYRQVVARRLMPAFGEVDIDRINRVSVQKMILSCPTRKSGQKAREVLSSILGSAAELGICSVNVASFRYQYPRVGNGHGRGEWLETLEEQMVLLEYLRERYGGEPEERMVVLGLCLGLRKCEILGLDWERVDFDLGEISVEVEYTIGEGGAGEEDPKTEKSMRRVPMTSYARERMLAWGPGSGPVVVGPGGGRMNPHTAGNRMRRLTSGTYNDGTPLPHVTLGTLRHCFATASIDAGVEVSKVSVWLGHKDITTTYNRYVRPRLSSLHGAAEAIDEALAAIARNRH